MSDSTPYYTGKEPEPSSFNPGDHTVQEVVDYAAVNPDEVTDILAAEQDGKGRVTLIRDLEALQAGETEEPS